MELEHTITSDGYIEFRMKLPTTGSLLEQELAIQNCINTAGSILTEQCLLNLDTDGSPINVGNTTYYSKGVEKKNTNVFTGQS